MKKTFCFVLSIVMLLTLCACGGESADVPAGAEGIDLDLSVMSTTMVYSQLTGMFENPEAYLGKSVKMTGSFEVINDATTGNIYFICLVNDATACCQQWLEFRLADGGTYPDDYPALDSTITVSGIFNAYAEGEYTYYELKDAILDTNPQ